MCFNCNFCHEPNHIQWFLPTLGFMHLGLITEDEEDEDKEECSGRIFYQSTIVKSAQSYSCIMDPFDKIIKNNSVL